MKRVQQAASQEAQELKIKDFTERVDRLEKKYDKLKAKEKQAERHKSSVVQAFRRMGATLQEVLTVKKRYEKVI